MVKKFPWGASRPSGLRAERRKMLGTKREWEVPKQKRILSAFNRGGRGFGRPGFPPGKEEGGGNEKPPVHT